MHRLRARRSDPAPGSGKPAGDLAKSGGELLKLGFQTCETTASNVLDRHGIQPDSVRNGSIGWRHLMNHYKAQLLVCDFFTVETITRQTIDVLFCIEIGSRRVHLAGVTPQARQIVWELTECELLPRFLIRDHDRKFTDAFDTIFRSAGMQIIPTPYRAPNANSFAERWISSCRAECLDHILIINETYLRSVLKEFSHDYYNSARPHPGPDQRIPNHKAGQTSSFHHGNHPTPALSDAARYLGV